MEVDLIKFLTNGDFGVLTIGVSKEKVIDEIGNPNDESIESSSNKIYKYGNVEITFGINDEIASIYIENENTDTDNRIKVNNYEKMKSIELFTLKEMLKFYKVKINREIFINKEKKEGLLKLSNYVMVSFRENVVTSFSICDPSRFSF
ncbi:hypothetical protein R5N98_05305 [Tenacibaculum maritimum]|uniref:hypothetical protein n=4 Tax=Tenacibaculum maritimum TaxID=107401 RepID=UPI0012E6C768|nr:hypothetical protein [Tenacibaculum maritimum]CAA0219411.1 hypothetical protein CVI1001048_320026 [Tenacibaculum maritimum]CAA0236084.1 hypothetical protein NCIMB2158_530002 [Tenacibaculum maritimum]